MDRSCAHLSVKKSDKTSIMLAFIVEIGTHLQGRTIL